MSFKVECSGPYEECDYCVFDRDGIGSLECDECSDASNFEPIEDFEDRKRKITWLKQAA